jgi:hypothetical protein
MIATTDSTHLEQVNKLAENRGLGGATKLGRYVLDTFFEGSPEKFRREGKSNGGFRNVIQSPRLKASYSLLYYSVAVTEQMDQLPTSVGDKLSFSHHKLLLPVKDPRTKEAFARKVVDEALSVRGLRDVVARHRVDQASRVRRGRPPLPNFVKALNRLPRIVEQVDDSDLDSDRLFDRYSPEQARALMLRTRTNLEKLEALLDRIEERTEDALA